MHSLGSILLLPIFTGATFYHFAAVSNAGKTVTVSPSDGGDFATLQAAINSVPDGNGDWIQIFVKAGSYDEKVNIPKQKQFIFLKGEGINATVIRWGDSGNVMQSPTFLLYADNFVASDMTFSNTYYAAGKQITWNPAALVSGDKVSFYRCGFTGLQDTLTDVRGRHYYESCFIKGATDFIWGQAQSMFKDCVINADAAQLGTGQGYITAQGRTDPMDPSALVVKQGSITGTGSSYLGRAHGKYSTVIFYQTNMDNVIVPKGWSAWNYAGQEGTISYSEEGCTGPGADLSRRVPWMKKLEHRDLSKFTNLNSFINQDGWMEKQPLQPN